MSLDKVRLSRVDSRYRPGAIFKPDELQMEAYHAGPGIGKSGLVKAAQGSIGKIGQSFKPSVHMVIGSAANDALMFPESFGDTWRQPHKPISTRRSKAWHEFEATIPKGQFGLTSKEYMTVMSIRHSVLAHPLAGPWFKDEGGLSEHSVFGSIDGYDVLLRVRPDRLILKDGRLTVVDLKTTQTADPGAFRNKVFQFNYHVSAWLYSEVLTKAFGVERVQYVFVVAEASDSSPDRVAVYELDDEFLHEGRQQALAGLEALQRYFAEVDRVGEEKAWKGYPLGVETISFRRQ